VALRPTTPWATGVCILTFALHFLLLSKNSYFCLRILTFVVIIITFVVRTKAKAKAQAKAKANAIVKIRTKGGDISSNLYKEVSVFVFF